MAHLINRGEGSFLSVKLIIGALAGYTLYRCSEIPIAKRGMKLVLGIYSALLGIHVATGFTALGWEAPATVLTYFVSLPSAFLALFYDYPDSQTRLAPAWGGSVNNGTPFVPSTFS